MGLLMYFRQSMEVLTCLYQISPLGCPYPLFTTTMGQLLSVCWFNLKPVLSKLQIIFPQRDTY